MRLTRASKVSTRVVLYQWIVINYTFANNIIFQELIEKRCAAMKAFEEYRSKRIQEWNNQKKRRLELRNGLYRDKYLY